MQQVEEANNPLLIVDVQEGFINEMTEHVVKKIELLQQEYTRVFITKFVNKPGKGGFINIMGWENMQKDDPGVKLAFERQPGSVIIEKNDYGAAYGIIHIALLGLSHPGEVVDICGLETDQCVIACAREMIMNSTFIPNVLIDYCASSKEGHHQMGIDIMERMHVMMETPHAQVEMDTPQARNQMMTRSLNYHEDLHQDAPIVNF